MKESPIIFSTDMVKVILDGLKTMTRRVIKPQPLKGGWNATAEHPSYGWFWRNIHQTWEGEEDFFKRLTELCPYGQVGSRLWVKEIWAAEKRLDYLPPSELGEAATVTLWYKADENQRTLLERGKWRPSIFMPRWASRILLEITEVRVERLQEIVFTDMVKEGINPQGKLPSQVKAEFIALWDSLNKKRDYGWSENNWVWVIGFRLIK